MNARRLVKAMARVWVAMLVCAGASPAVAQIVGEGRALAGQFNDAATITLDVRDRMLDDVLDHIRNKVGVSIVTTPGTDGTVTIKLSLSTSQHARQRPCVKRGDKGDSAPNHKHTQQGRRRVLGQLFAHHDQHDHYQ